MGFSPAHPVSDSEYLLERAEAELRLADAASNAAAAEAHRALASAYLGRVFSEDQRDPSDIWQWLRAAREKREALASIFHAEPEGLASADAPIADESFSDILERLDGLLDPVD